MNMLYALTYVDDFGDYKLICGDYKLICGDLNQLLFFICFPRFWCIVKGSVEDGLFYPHGVVARSAGWRLGL